LTLVEVLVVVLVLGVLATMILPRLAGSRRSSRIGCVSNLKQIGLAFRIWSGDNSDKYPFHISVTNGGTMGLNNGKNAWLNFLVMSNELSTPKILVCPKDLEHQPPVTNFSWQLVGHVSYLIGVDANEADPQAILSGDDNFEINGVSVKSGLLELSSNTPIAWTTARHNHAGNLGFADGSVQQATSLFLRQAVGLATNRLAIP
jgi:prepilin-type processing-associated H-X9-DG protein